MKPVVFEQWVLPVPQGNECTELPPEPTLCDDRYQCCEESPAFLSVENPSWNFWTEGATLAVEVPAADRSNRTVAVRDEYVACAEAWQAELGTLSDPVELGRRYQLLDQLWRRIYQLHLQSGDPVGQQKALRERATLLKQWGGFN